MNTTRHTHRKEKNPLWLKVRSALALRGLTQHQLASELGVHRNTIRAAVCSDLCPKAKARILSHLRLSA